MPMPELNIVAADLYEEVSPAMTYAEEQTDYPLAHLIEALTRPLANAAEIAYERWETILDAELTPDAALRWAAQFYGVDYTGMTDEQVRTALQSPTGFARGTPGSIVAAAQRHLTGTKTVLKIERFGSPYVTYVRTRLEETPDPDLVEWDIKCNAKPGGLVLDYDAIDYMDFATLATTYSDFAAVAAAYDTFGEIPGDV